MCIEYLDTCIRIEFFVSTSSMDQCPVIATTVSADEISYFIEYSTHQMCSLEIIVISFEGTPILSFFSMTSQPTIKVILMNTVFFLLLLRCIAPVRQSTTKTATATVIVL